MEQLGAPTKGDIEYFKKQRRLARDRNPIGDAGLPLELAPKSKDQKIKFPVQGTGQETRAFCFIDDFIDGLMLVLEKGENLGTYHIGTTEEISIEKVAQEIGKYFEKEIEIVAGEEARGGTKRRCPDITKIKKMGFTKKISLKVGLKKVISNTN